MKNLKRITLFLITLFIAFIFTTNFTNAASTTVVNTEDELVNAINNASEGDIIELSTNISLKRPIEITGKTITINAKGNTITREETNWSPNGSNGSLITAGSGSKLTLVNATLKDAQKYGLQAYDGGYIIVNNVTIANCGFGGILVNGGTLEVKELHLQKNGTPNNNGIEIAKGDAVASSHIPTVIMNGTISSTEKENVIYVAENNPNLNKFEVKNTSSTTHKILIKDNQVVITDKNNTILYTSNEIKNVEVAGENYIEKAPVIDETEDKNEDEKDKKDETPKTGIETHLIFAILVATLSTISIITFRKKEMYQ